MITPEPVELEIAASALRAHADRLYRHDQRSRTAAEDAIYAREGAICDAVAAWLDAKAARAARRRIAKPSDTGQG